MEPEKLSLSKCKTILILQKDASIYTDEEISQIRDFLYMLAKLDYEVFLKTQKKEVITQAVNSFLFIQTDNSMYKLLIKNYNIIFSI